MEERLGEMRKGRRERIEKGSHCFFKSSGYDKMELKHKNLLLFFKLIECIRLFQFNFLLQVDRPTQFLALCK